MGEQTRGRQKAADNMAKLKSELRLQPHADVTVAFDLAEAALVQAIRNDVHKSFAKPEREITRRMFRAMMDSDFMIMHREEIQDTILVAAQIKDAMAPQMDEENAIRAEVLEALRDAQRVLAMLTEPASISGSTVTNAWAACVAAELKARTVLAKADRPTPVTTEGGGENG